MNMRGPYLTFGPFEFDPASRLLKRDGVELPLPPRVIGVLEVLLRRAGDVVPRQELMDIVWKDAFVTDTSLAEAVSVLRQALGDDAQAPSFIQTFHRRGYRFVAPVDPRIPTPGHSPEPEKVAGTFPEKVPATFAEGPSIVGQLIPWSVAAVCVVLAGVAVREAIIRREPPAPPVTRYAVAPAAGTEFDGRAPALAISADASRLAWSGCDASGCRLYARPADRLDAIPLAGTEGAAAPFFSPDGAWIGFFAEGHLKKVTFTGGSPVTLADAADPLGAVWTGNHDIIYAGGAPGLRVIRDGGGEPQLLTTPRAAAGEVRHLRPSLLEKDVLLFTTTSSPDVEAHGRLTLLKLDGRPRPWMTLFANVHAAAAVSHDAIVFSVGQELQAVGVDVQRGQVSSPASTVMTGLATAGGAGQFAVSATGALVTVSATPSTASTLFWTVPSGANGTVSTRRQDVAIQVKDIDAVALSPDGTRAAAFNRTDGAKRHLWIVDLERGAVSRLTHAGASAAPIWSADGTTVVFASSDGGPFAIYQRHVDSPQPARRIHGLSEHALPCAVSPDGSSLAFTTTDPTTGADIWTIPLSGGPAQPLIRTPFDDVAASFSPDGTLIAYQSNDAGRWEVYVQRRADQRRVTVSSGGGTRPFWSTDGRALFFRTADRLMRAVVAPDGLSVGSPVEWSHIPGANPVGIDPAGRVLYQRSATFPANTAIVTLQWVREMRQLLGPPSPALPR
jgi:DNA-binding winged helix-turn-helix (wHTH) protein